MTQYAVITTLNEEVTIGHLVEDLRGLGLGVIVVDDASDDDTVYDARHAGASVIAHVLRTGIGPSLVEGWRYALEHGAEAVAQLDAGGSHYPQHIPHMIYRLQWAEVVVGSRFCRGAMYHGNVKRAVMSRMAALACNVKHFHRPYGINDWTSGYRVFRADALRKLVTVQYTAIMHGWQIEVLRAALLLGMRVTEVPIVYRAGRSSFDGRVAREAFDVWRADTIAVGEPQSWK